MISILEIFSNLLFSDVDYSQRASEMLAQAADAFSFSSNVANTSRRPGFILSSDGINISRKDQRVASYSPRFSNDAPEPRPAATTIIPSPHLQSHAPQPVSSTFMEYPQVVKVISREIIPAQSCSTLQTAPTPISRFGVTSF